MLRHSPNGRNSYYAEVCCLQDAGPNHYWISGTDVPYMFELGGPAHEGCAGIVALSHYLHTMAAQSPGTGLSYHMPCQATCSVKSHALSHVILCLLMTSLLLAT